MERKKVTRVKKATKITWEVIYSDFRRHHPTLRKDVIYWRPYNFATIMLYMVDGTKMLYNYDSNKATFYREEDQ